MPRSRRVWESRVRIALDLTLHVPNAGGISRVIRELLSFFSNQPQHTFFAFVRDPIPPEFPRTDGIEYLPLPIRSPEARVVWLLTQAAGAAERHALDVWFSPNLYVPLRLRIPSVLTIADLAFAEVPDRYSTVRRLVYELLVRRADRATRVVVYTAAIKSELERMYHLDPARIDVTPLAARSDFKPAAPIPRSLRAANLVCSVGSSSRKNGEVAVQAFDRLAPRFGGLELMLYHAGRLHREAVEAIRRSRYRRRIHDLGYVADADLQELVRTATAFVYPSLAEGFGLPILEAMSLGTPVVCSSLPVHLEVVGDGNALMFPAGRADELAATIEQVITDEVVWQRLADRGLARARSFSWSACGEATLQSIVRAASERPISRSADV
ncbi:MAG: glycosyltransferase family 1 protein [Chloroflexota bacterium]